jgi:2-keto-4-pentenoate hydratase/2-oxohepta-3-ene-1,7-dioic acid hydratase in catechol pathway
MHQIFTPRFLFLIFLLPALTVPGSGAMFCRFEAKGVTAYAEVIDEQVHVLTGAPWAGGTKTGETLALDDVRLLAPSEPALIAGLSKSYRSAWPEGGEPPAVRWFIKPPGAAAAPDAPLLLPEYLDEVKVEVELVIVMGKTVKNASPSEAASAIFGYTLGNDIVGQVSSFQRLTGDSIGRAENVLGPGLKAGDGFAPFGPFIHTGIDWRGHAKRLEVTSTDPTREVVDPTHTSDLIYAPEKIVSDLSKVMTLRPGDIIFSGTNKSYPVRSGDHVKISIEDIGEITTVIK